MDTTLEDLHLLLSAFNELAHDELTEAREAITRWEKKSAKTGREQELVDYNQHVWAQEWYVTVAEKLVDCAERRGKKRSHDEMDQYNS
jgi:hypothetical protein